MLKVSVSRVSFYLQRLTDPAVFPDVQNAVTKRDRGLFFEICRKLEIPKKYIDALMDTILRSEDPDQADPWF